MLTLWHGRYKGPAQHLCGGIVLTSPGDAPASLPATTTLNTHAILLDASSLTSAALGRFESLFGREVAGFGWARGLVL